MTIINLDTYPRNKPGGAIAIREVWAENLESEFELISGIIDDYPFVSMDTEFPGVIFKSDLRRGNPADLYSLLKSNVDALSLIRSVLLSPTPTVTSPISVLAGGSSGSLILRISMWHVTHAPDSIELLRRQGIDFERNCRDGVDSRDSHAPELPCALGEFQRMMKALFGERVYDMKHMMRFCERNVRRFRPGGRTLEVSREVGKCHQAGSDSLLTWHAFQRMRDLYFLQDGPEKHAGVLYGLEVF
ncbi:hypothetical protein Bca52824_039495 [Brassica carinata]|uniref:Uncharacterized protein n=1 Tax=Brassica carinata TaxID=52824 RepID=A0A8X7RR56_BRACI|nr:hypothetical protein Bca52824_039495 [Brassica carinata]